MAQQLTPELAAAVQAMMDNVEAAYKQTNAMRTSLSVLMAAGQATCTDVKTYNLQVKAVYAYQASVAGIIRANGGQAPSVPAPIYVTYKGVTGDQAANIDCGTAQLRGWRPTSLGDYFVDPRHVAWKQEALPSDNQTVAAIVAQAGNNAVAAGQLQGPLGIAPLVVVAIVIVGIVVAVVATIVLRIVEALTDIPGKKETTRQIALQAEQHRQTLDQRAACYTDCVNRGKDPAECAKNCARLTPDFKPTIASGGLGIFGTILGVAVVGGLVFVGWKVVAPRLRGKLAAGRGGAHRALPEPDVIDAEYTERAA